MGINLRNEINLYLQELLKLQFNASNGISHRPTKGELREKFIKRIILEKFSTIILQKGILVKDEWQSPEMDFLHLQHQSDDMNIYDLCNCKLLMEIKSSLQKKELEALNEVANTIKTKCEDGQKIIVGMFCYSSRMKDKTLINFFGHSYDKTLGSYNAYNTQLDLFKNIDFIFSLNIEENEETSPYFISRNIDGTATLFPQNPVIKYLFNYFP